jgi:predicted site-specific integrase-resolvase
MQTNILNREQAASTIGISINSLDTLIKQGLIAKVQLSPRRIGIMKADLDAYLQSIRSGGAELVA